MMQKSTRIVVPNSLVFVMDPTMSGYLPVPVPVPVPVPGELTAATSRCVAICTLADVDGPTLIGLGDEIDDTKEPIVFDGMLEAPGGCIAVCASGAEVLLMFSIRGARARVRVWANDASEPDEIQVFFTDVSI